MSAYDLLSPQEEELEALRSIWGDEWVDSPPQKTAWNVKGEDGWWTVRVKGSDERVSVKLKGRSTKSYPKAPPSSSLEEPVNLTPNQVQTLQRIINDKAKHLSSAEEPVGFIYDITDCIHDWISNNHVPLPKVGETVPTSMEEMAQREEAQRAAEIAQDEAERTQRLARIAEQDRSSNEKIQHDASLKAQRANQAIQDEAARRRQESLATLADGESEMRELEVDEPISVEGHNGSFRSWVLFGGKREPFWTSYTAEPAPIDGTSGFVKATSPTSAVQVVDFSVPFYNTAQGRKKVDAVAVELGRLKEVRCENVVKIYGVKRDKSPRGWERLIVMTEKVEGGKLKNWLPKEGFTEEMAREYITQLLNGSVYIHRIGATQKQIDPNFTYLCPRESGEAIAKFSGTGYARRIGDLHRSNPFSKAHEEEIPEPWLSPDEIDSSYTYTPKRDVWHVGVLLVQSLFGPQSLWRYPSLQILLQHSPGSTESMVDLLHGLSHPNSKKRFTAEEALNRARAVDEVTRRGNTGQHAHLGHHGHHGHHGHASSSSISIPPALSSPKAIFGTSPVSALNYFPQTIGAMANHAPRSSRYREDFQEVEFLGKGGFGEVVKARNRLDGRSYAIKKVKLRPEDNEAKVYREVNNSSRVSHPNIVRYHACWIEDANPSAAASISDASDATTPTASVSEEASDPFAVNFDDLSRSRDQSRSASFPRIRFANSESDSEDDEDESGSDTESDSSEETAADPSEHFSRGRAMTMTRARPIIGPGGHIGPSGSGTGTTTDDGAVQSISYIQMEFVEKQTSREAITAGLEEDEVWRSLEQISQASAHMASLGIVHRDLKPSNILIDASGNVKIADFGLSTTEMSAVEAASAPNGSMEESDRTSGIGTSLYIAPEVAISRSYNEKADMYSLGVIFFEMCFAFKTNMERVHISNALRQPSITFPPAWPKDAKPKEREIVEWLSRHDPNMRPKAEQLLASPSLPAREKQKEFYDNAIPELTNPRSSHYGTSLKTLFDPQTHIYTFIENRTNDYTYDNPTDHSVESEPWMTVVTARLTDLLQRHGAVETKLPSFIPETLLLQAFPDLAPVRSLDKSGKIIQSPSSDLLSMARSATRRQIERIKRYHIGRRYRDHVSGGQPNAEEEVSFDIISPIRSWAAEAECLDVVDKVVMEMGGSRGVSGEFEIHISHETVLASMLNAVPERARSSVLKALKDISANLGAPSRANLGVISGLPRSVQDDSEQCCGAGEFPAVKSKLEASFPNAKRKMGPALDALSAIIDLSLAFGVKTKILFRPSLSRNAEFFRGGFMFECIRKGKQRDTGKQRELVAFGGRYDSSLEHFKAPAQHRTRRVYGVGMSLAVEPSARLVGATESALARRHLSQHVESNRSFGYWSPARCDVYVMNVHQVDSATRLAIVGELWRAGVRTDSQYDDERGFNDIVEECSEQNTLFIVQPQPARAGPMVKVYNVLRPSAEKELIHRSELCSHSRHAITEQRRSDASYASAEGSLPFSQATALSGGTSNDNKTRESQIKMISPPEPGPVKGGKKGEKKKNQRFYLQASKFVFTDKLDEFLEHAGTNLPILGVDLSASLLSQLTLDTAWIHDDEAWRTVSANHFGDERKYLEQVREHVQKEVRGEGGGAVTAMSGVSWSHGAGKKMTWVWSFSVREAKGFLLQPSR